MKMLHVTVQTARFEEEIAFYRDIVGLTIRRDARPGRNMVFLSDSEGDTEIEIIENSASADAGNAFLSVDGGRAMRVYGGDSVLIEAGNQKIKLIKLKDTSFFDIVISKLNK